VAEWQRDDHITLVANPRFPGPKPAFPTVIVRDIPDQATSVLSIEKGDIDMLTDPRPDDAKALAGQSGLRVAEQPSNNVSYLAMDVEKPPFGDRRVRQAVAYAIDVVSMAMNLYSSGAVRAGNWTPPAMLGENSAVTPYTHDAATTDDARRALVYRRANAMVHDEVPAIPLVHTSVPVVLKASLKGYVPSPNTTYHFNLIHGS
jgi:peptide/nickel transport system substrate-binding protein